MKQNLFIFLSIPFTTCAFAQGITKNGKITSIGSEYVNKNCAIGASEGVDKNGRIVSAGLPSLTTITITLITSSGATTGGNVTSVGTSGITIRGLCWNTEEHPTTDGPDKVTLGVGLGSYTFDLTGLLPNTTYYIRAFAYNNIGTAYGNELSFTTYSPPVGGLAICDGTRPTTVVAVTSPITSKIWMDRNLGASRAATSARDYEAYGCFYQWGRGNDGHASIRWNHGDAGRGSPINGSTTAKSSTDDPGHVLFIRYAGEKDWRSTPNDNLWQGVNGINNPCTSGFRVPTIAELAADISIFDDMNVLLKLTYSGTRESNADGTEDYVDKQGMGPGNGNIVTLSSSTVNGTSAYYRTASSLSQNDMATETDGRGIARAVRCIKNE